MSIHLLVMVFYPLVVIAAMSPAILWTAHRIRMAPYEILMMYALLFIVGEGLYVFLWKLMM